MIDAAVCKSELRRLDHGPLGNEQIPGVGIVQFVVKCDGNASDVLNTAISVMKTVCSECASGWSEGVEWQSLLPAAFVSACAKEMTPEEADRWLNHWLSLSHEERESEERDRRWSLDNWVHWLQPNERLWQWWDARLDNADRITVSVAVESWPFGWGAITWLFRGSGAVNVTPIGQSVD